jgi:hypothetical protein
MRRTLISVLLLVTLAAWTTDAAACKLKPYPAQFPTGSTAGGSSQPPPALSLVDARVTRSKYAPPGNGDCGEVGSLHLQFEIVGSSSWPADLGVRLSLVGGSLPPAFQGPEYALVAPQGTLDFSGGDDPSQPMDFTLQARAVDSAGNESSPIEVHLTDSGRSGGCSFAGKASRGSTLWNAFFGLLLGGALFRTLRRRRA